jgi:hypothetical protein
MKERTGPHRINSVDGTGIKLMAEEKKEEGSANRHS